MNLGTRSGDGLVVLVESDEMRERGHEGPQLGESLPVRGRDP